MKHFFKRLPVFGRRLGTALLYAGVTTALPAFADKPAWKPMAELLVVSIGEADPAGMVHVINRCTALNITMAGMLSEYSPDVSAYYEAEALSMMQQGVLIDSRIKEEASGEEIDISSLSSATIDRVKTHLSGYSDWMDENMASGGTYFNDEIELEMDSCNLASKFINGMND